MAGECKQSCAETCEGGIGDMLPTCETDADCIGGQICQDLMGMAALCISACTSDADCSETSTCQELGAMGMTLAQVCDCSTNDDCGEGLECCEIPLVGQKTCLTQCIDLGGLM